MINIKITWEYNSKPATVLHLECDLGYMYKINNLIILNYDSSFRLLEFNKREQCLIFYLVGGMMSFWAASMSAGGAFDFAADPVCAAAISALFTIV